jgi:uncharacterized paraquat-inducible protein A
MADDVKFTDLFDPSQPRSDKDIIEQRLEICKACPDFKKNTQRCRHCGCFMQLKATLTLAKCPIGKW